MKKRFAGILLCVFLCLVLLPILVLADTADTIDLTGATVTVNKEFRYNGTEQAPTKEDVTVTLSDGTTVVSSDYYTLKATKGTIPATYALSVTGDGTNCTGSVEGTWELKKGLFTGIDSTGKVVQVVLDRAEGCTTIVWDSTELFGELSNPICEVTEECKSWFSDDHNASSNGMILTIYRNDSTETFNVEYNLSADYYEDALVLVTIRNRGKAKDTLKISVTMDSWTYGETASEPQYDKKYSALKDYIGFFYNRTETYYQGETKLSGKPTDVGTYKVVVSYEDDGCIYTGEATFTISIATTTLTFALPKEGEQYVLYLPYSDTHLLLPEGSERFKGLSFAGYDADIIDVDANGNVIGKQLGETSVTVKVEDTNYTVADVTVLVKVTPVRPNGGSVETTTVNTIDGKVTTLPTPTRTGYTFDGWFTEKEGGEPVDENTVFDDNTTIYAHWTVATYTITFHVTGTPLSSVMT